DADRPDRAFEHRREGDVEDVPALFQETTRFSRFCPATIGQVDVGPAGEAVLLVPGTFAVAKQNHLMHVLPSVPRSAPSRPALLRSAAAGCICRCGPSGSPTLS